MGGLILNLKLLLERGYFPKELPPPFTTKHFANKFNSINTAWSKIKAQFKDSECIKYSIPKVGYSRTIIGIPNPLHQSILSKSISDNWSEIDDFCKKSKLSASRPVIDPTDESYVKTFKTFGEFKKSNLRDSFDGLYELKTDFSRYYSTIYTHTISWALYSKETAKSKRTDHSLLGNILDKNVRNCESSQSVGIPVGPVTSLILSEIISCRIDQFLQNEFNSIKGYKFIDDYYLFFSTKEEAEKALKYLQSILSDFKLEMNMEKTNINKFPIPFEKDWSVYLNLFNFEEEYKKQGTNLLQFFSLSFQFAQEKPLDSVLRYAISRLRSVLINAKNWDLYESLLLKTAISEPVTLPNITRILITHKKLVNKDKIEKIIEKIIEEHSPKKHSFEVSWALWLAKTFNLKIKKELAKNIFKSDDVISILIALDLKNNGLIDSKVDTSFLIDDLTKESLFEENWLLTYESIIKNWLVPKDSTILESNPCFKILKDNKVSFYDETNQLKPIVISELENIDIYS